MALLLGACSRSPDPAVTPQAQPAAQSPASAIPRPDNVLLVTIDTLRADYLGCYGRKSVATPNLDRLAARGVRFTTAIAQVPLTAPSHASILTGAYPPLHKLRDMGGFALDGSIPTLATVAGQAGLRTAAFVGSAVLHRAYGLDRGFSTYDDRMRAPKDSKAKKLPGVVAEVRGEVVTARALQWLNTLKSGERFFLWAHYYDPHFPYDPPEPYRARYPDRYGGEVAYTDEVVGRLLDGLDARGHTGRTLVVLLADHGESLGEHGEPTHGVFLYDSTLRVPLVVAGPGIPAGRVVTAQVRAIDVMPTIAAFLGVAQGDRAQGVSLIPAIVEGRGVRSNYCYVETIYPKTHHGWSELRGMRTDEWKLVVAPKPELYRIDPDGAERENVLARHPAEADHLQKKIWEVSGAPQGGEELRPDPIHEERRRELSALGYVSAGSRPLRIDMSGPDPKDRVAVLGMLDRGGDLMNHDRFAEAAATLERARADDPGNPLVYTQLGLCYQSLGRFDRAEAVYRDAIANRAEGDQTHAELGELYVRRGELARAVESMERAAKLNPANLDNLDNLATAYLHLGKPDQTERVLRAILASDPRHAMASNLYGILEIQRGRPEAARTRFEAAVRSDPDIAESYMNLGLLEASAGRNKSAAGYYREFLKRASPAAHREVIPKVRAALAELLSNPSP